MLLLREAIGNNSLLKYHLKVMRYCGFILFDDQRYHFVHKCRGFILLFIMTVLVTGQIIDLCQAIGDIGKMTTNASTTIIVSVGVAQCYEFLFFRSDLLQALFVEIDTSMEKIYNFPIENGDNGDRHRRNIMKILDKSVRNSTIFALGFFVTSFTIGSMLGLWTLVKYLQVVGLSVEEREDVNLLLLRCWYPFDVYENFIPVYIHQVFCCSFTGVLVPLITTLIVLFKIYTIAMLEILEYRCEMITDNTEGIRSIGERDQLLNQKMRDCILAQLKLTQFVQNLDKLISTSMFVVFALFSLLLCSLLFQVSTMDFGAAMFVPISFIVNMILMLLMYYWHANEIAYQSSNLPNSIYFCNWYTCTKKFKRIMLIFMIGSQRPLKLSALYFTMNLEVFINILKASYSYFTLLSQLSSRH